MKILIAYDSFFGNPEQIARAIGGALENQQEVTVLRASEVAPGELAGQELLIVGSPTRAFRPSPAVSGLLNNPAAPRLNGVKVAAFDTRAALSDVGSPFLRFFMKFGGYAAKPMADMLKRLGGSLILPPEGFFVEGTEGPLKAGELERAAEWGKRINEAVKAR
jgi:flavodoxin I